MRRLESTWSQRIVVGSVVMGLFLGGHAAVAQQRNPEEPALRNSDPLGVVVADLESYVPERMSESGVPGLAVALIRGGRVAWVSGFGTTSRFAGSPVTAETVFEVASNSKVVTAYAALRLVDRGQLTLDEPLALSLQRPWLPDSQYADEVTLRHLASHTSGLPDNSVLPVALSIEFEPGSQFSYSGVGFEYMQDAIEQVAGSPLEDFAREAVFEPLGMASSSFVGRSDLDPLLASGHVNYALPLLLFFYPFVGLSLVLLLASVVVRRVRAGTWHPTRKLIGGIGAVAAVASLILVFLTLRKAVPNLALLAILEALVLAGSLALVSWGTRSLGARLAEPKKRRRFNAAAIVISFLFLVLAAASVSGPMPTVLAPPPSAIGSLRTTAPDLATFLAEVASPSLLSEEIAVQLVTPQAAIDNDFSWGLGIGIQHSDQGDALWQNGITPGFRSVMVIYPEHQWGVVVLTNSDDGLQVAYDVAARALGGKAHWSFF